METHTPSSYNTKLQPLPKLIQNSTIFTCHPLIGLYQTHPTQPVHSITPPKKRKKKTIFFNSKKKSTKNFPLNASNHHHHHILKSRHHSIIPLPPQLPPRVPYFFPLLFVTPFLHSLFSLSHYTLSSTLLLPLSLSLKLKYSPEKLKMAIKCAAVVVMMAVVAAAMVAQSESAPSPVDCTTVVMGMSDCLSYVTNGSKIDKPEGSCCSGLKSVLKTNAECLCEGFKSSSQFGVVLNVTKALALPDACHVHAPSAAKCGLSLSPAGAPSQAPAAGGAAVSPAGAPSASSTANAPSTGIGGSEMSPAMAPGSASSSNSVGIPVQLIVVGLAASFFSRF